MCVCERETECVCMCVCVREREPVGGGGRGGGGGLVKSKETVGNSWTVLKVILGHKSSQIIK